MKKAVCVMGLIAMLSTLFGCGKNTPTTSVTTGVTGEYKEVVSLYFSEGGYCPGIYCDIHPDEKNAEKTVMVYIDYDKNGKEKKYKIDRATMDAISTLCSNLNILSWDGYDMCDEDVLDGGGFSLNIVFEDGTTVRAEGDNCFPENYSEFTSGMSDILSSVTGK